MTEPEYLPPVVGAYNRSAAEALFAGFEYIMRGEHMPAAVEAREQRDRARRIAVMLEQDNALALKVIREAIAETNPVARLALLTIARDILGGDTA